MGWAKGLRRPGGYSVRLVVARRDGQYMYADELIGYLRADHKIEPAEIAVADRSYVCPTEDWFFGEFAEALRVLYQELGVATFEEESNDCDDFTRLAAAFAQVLHHRTGAHRKSALSIGEFWYFRGGNPLDEHAFLIARFDTRAVGFMEVQNQSRAYLKENEKCTRYRF